MGKFNVVEDLEMRTRGGLGGVGGYNEDISDDLNEMRYGEKLVLNKDFLEALASLKVAHVEGNVIKGGTLLIPRADVITQTGVVNIPTEINGIAHAVNREFVSLEIPFYATSYASDDAEKVVKTAKKGKYADKPRNVTVADTLRVYKISEKFEVDRYACDGSKKVKDEGINNYHEPTTGQRLRASKWIEENGEELADLLKAVGVDLE